MQVCRKERLNFLRFSIPLLVLIVFWVSGCVTGGDGAGTPSDRELSNGELSFFDSITFDNQLSSSMASKLPVITVKVIAPFTTNNIPERLDKWLASVRKYGGQVELKPDPDYPASRSLGFIFDLLKRVYDYTKEMLIYKKAENYDATVFYKPESGEVTKFVFTLKEGVR